MLPLRMSSPWLMASRTTPTTSATLIARRRTGPEKAMRSHSCMGAVRGASAHALGLQPLGGRSVDHLAVVGEKGSGHHLVLGIDGDLPVFDQDLKQGEDVPRIEAARVVRHRGGEVRRAEDQDAVVHHLAVGGG